MGLWLDQATGRRLDRGLGARRRAKLGPSIVYVKIDCPLGQMQLARDLGGRLAARQTTVPVAVYCDKSQDVL